MTSWLARKVAGDPDFFARVPDVLGDWVAYSGRRRGVPASRLADAVAAVEDYREEMLESVQDSRAWGLAKAFAASAVDAGIDLTDPDEIERLIRHYNDGLAA